MPCRAQLRGGIAVLDFRLLCARGGKKVRHEFSGRCGDRADKSFSEHISAHFLSMDFSKCRSKLSNDKLDRSPSCLGYTRTTTYRLFASDHARASRATNLKGSRTEKMPQKQP